MARQRLVAVLVGSWMIFALLTGVGALGGGLVAAYMVEDGLINRQLGQLASEVRSGAASAATLPPDFSLHGESDLPIDIGAEFPAPRDGAIREFRRAGGRYVHVAVIGTGPTRQYLVHDVSDALVVGPAFWRTLFVTLGLFAGYVLLAGIVALTIGQRAERRARALLHDLRVRSTPAEVRRLADEQASSELHEFLSMHADVWEERSRLLQEQQETLGYLAHELRTPLQSARNSLAVLRSRDVEEASVERLDRALARLTRASHAALLLAGNSRPATHEPVSLGTVWDDLCREYAAAAAHRGCTLEPAAGADLALPVEREEIETILSNLLGNAIRHGMPGPVQLRSSPAGFTVRNRSSTANTKGYGLGLTIVRRMCSRIGWGLNTGREGDRFFATVTLSGSKES